MIALSNMTVKQALHERICLLYAKLQGDPVTLAALAQFDRETGFGITMPDGRETTYKSLVDALWAYEETTGGEVHPVDAELEGLLL